MWPLTIGIETSTSVLVRRRLHRHSSFSGQQTNRNTFDVLTFDMRARCFGNLRFLPGYVESKKMHTRVARNQKDIFKICSFKLFLLIGDARNIFQVVVCKNESLSHPSTFATFS